MKFVKEQIRTQQLLNPKTVTRVTNRDHLYNITICMAGAQGGRKVGKRGTEEAKGAQGVFFLLLQNCNPLNKMNFPPPHFCLIVLIPSTVNKVY